MSNLLSRAREFVSRGQRQPRPDPVSAYRMLQDQEGLEDLRRELQTAEAISVVVHPLRSGYLPGEGRFLLGLAPTVASTTGAVRLIDSSQVDLAALGPVLSSRELLVHDSLSVLPFLARKGIWSNGVKDTKLMAQLLAAGTKSDCSLKAACRDYLGQDLSATSQISNREADLSPSLCLEVANATRMLQPLATVLDGWVTSTGMQVVAEIENACAQCVTWMSLAGIGVDQTRWRELPTNSSNRAGLSRSYGPGWLRHVRADGRIYPQWWQIGTITGRMTATDPNIQGLPRGAHRSCICAAPGYVIVRADYSQIELRIAARQSNDREMLRVFLAGEDIHLTTAQRILRVEKVTPEDRHKVKAIVFGVMYQMGPTALRSYAKATFAIDLSEADAADLRMRILAAYPELTGWQRSCLNNSSAETRTILGRRQLLTTETSPIAKINSPIQGSCADGLKTALALLWRRRAEAPYARPIMAVHDEIVLEVRSEFANQGEQWLRCCMVEAMRPILLSVPVEVSVSIGPTWR